MFQVILLGGVCDATVRIAEYERKMERKVKTLEGLLPLCSFCKKIRTEDGRWERVEDYVHEHSETDFTHTFCPQCAARHYHLMPLDSP